MECFGFREEPGPPQDLWIDSPFPLLSQGLQSLRNWNWALVPPFMSQGALKGFFQETQALRLSRVSKAQAGPGAAPSHPTWKPHLGLVAWVCETPCVRPSKSLCGGQRGCIWAVCLGLHSWRQCAWSGQEKLSFSRWRGKYGIMVVDRAYWEKTPTTEYLLEVRP